MSRPPAKANLNIHFNAPSVRSDTWGKLRNATSRLVRLSEGSPAYEKTRATIAGLLAELEPIEAYWGFPGKEEFARLLGQFRDSQYLPFHQAVLATSEQLDSGEYRRMAVERALGCEPPDVHYFDLLVVSHLTRDEEHALEREMYRWRSGHDPLVYNLVVVHSFVDALIAVMFNFDVQAV